MKADAVASGRVQVHVFLVVFLVCCVCAAGDTAVSLTRTTLVVADKVASLQFYRDLLGFEVVFEGPYGGSTFHSIFDLQPDDPVYFTILKSPNTDSAMLGLLEIGGETVVRQTPRDSNVPGFGETLLWMTTQNLHARYTRLRDSGATIVAAPFETAGGREMIVADPDGIRMYIFEPDQAAGE